MDDKILNGYYTKDQITALNNIKAKKDDFEKNKDDSVEGASGDLKSDLQNVLDGKDVGETNTEIFNYIDKTIQVGRDNFAKLVDSDGDGTISSDEAQAVVKYAGHLHDLTSEDINAFVENVMKLDSATLGEKGGTSNVEYTLNSDGQFVEKEDNDEEYTNKKDEKTKDYIFSSNISSKDQIDALNEIKKKESKFNELKNDDDKKTIEGDLDNFVNDINNYTSDKDSKNKELLDYINKTVGVESFRNFLNEKGKLEEGDEDILAKYIDDGKLSSKDINALLEDAFATESLTAKIDGKEITYKLNDKGELTEDSSTNKDGKKNADAEKYFLKETFADTKQIDALNEIKKKKISDSDLDKADIVEGDKDKFQEDMESYMKNNNISDVKNDANKKLFDYIEDKIGEGGMENFAKLIDKDADGKISKEEADKIASYYKNNNDENDKLTSQDINELIKDINKLESAKAKKDGKEVEYELKDGQLVEKKTKPEDTETEKYNEDGTLKTKIDKEKGFTTEYTYKDGKLVSSTTTGKGGVKMHEYTYDDKGRAVTKHEFVSEEYGTAGEFTHKFTYDDQGRVKTSKIYKGDETSESSKAEPIGDYEFTYPDEKTHKASKRTNHTNGEVVEYSYKDNKLDEAKAKDKDGNALGTKKYNTNGTLKSIMSAKSNTTSFRKYETDTPYISEVNTYNNSDLDSDGNPKSDAKTVRDAYYKDGKLDKQTGDAAKTESFAQTSSTGSSDKSHLLSTGVKAPKDAIKNLTKEKSNISTSKINSELANKIDAKLGSGFCDEVEQLADELKCDPEDILTMMFSESGLDPSAGAAEGTAGLTQFIAGCEPTADGYTPTLAELRGMSALEQLKYIKADLIECKRFAGYSDDDEIDLGTLYAMNFLPAFAHNEVLCSSGDIYYNSNYPLDFDGDGQITKTDLANHLKEKRKEMYAEFGL